MKWTVQFEPGGKVSETQNVNVNTKYAAEILEDALFTYLTGFTLVRPIVYLEHW